MNINKLTKLLTIIDNYNIDFKNDFNQSEINREDILNMSDETADFICSTIDEVGNDKLSKENFIMLLLRANNSTKLLALMDTYNINAFNLQ